MVLTKLNDRGGGLGVDPTVIHSGEICGEASVPDTIKHEVVGRGAQASILTTPLRFGYFLLPFVGDVLGSVVAYISFLFPHRCVLSREII